MIALALSIPTLLFGVTVQRRWVSWALCFAAGWLVARGLG